MTQAVIEQKFINGDPFVDITPNGAEVPYRIDFINSVQVTDLLLCTSPPFFFYLSIQSVHPHNIAASLLSKL